jgi:hypothetical protein
VEEIDGDHENTTDGDRQVRVGVLAINYRSKNRIVVLGLDTRASLDPLPRRHTHVDRGSTSRVAKEGVGAPLNDNWAGSAPPRPTSTHAFRTS